MSGIDEELDQMKLTLDSLDDFLNQVARKLSEKMPSDLREPFLLHPGYRRSLYS